MNVEKSKVEKPSVRELESHHFNMDPSGGLDMEVFRDNKKALKIAKELLLMKAAKLIMDIDSENSNRALVKNGKGEIIFVTTLPVEIEELADIAFNTPR